MVVKSQILAGGRGLGTFKNGFKGGVHIVDTEKAKSLAEKMLGQVLVTKQSGEGGKPVNALYLASKLDLVNEMYFAILLDRASAGPMLIGCSEGGPSSNLLLEDMHWRISTRIGQHTNIACQQSCNFLMSRYTA